MNRVKEAINEIGGVEAAAKLTGVSGRAIYKWIERGKLPRTDYTGETNYAAKIAGHKKARFTADWLLQPQQKR